MCHWQLAASVLAHDASTRSRIADELGMPPGTVRSLIRRVHGSGVEGFIDLRRRVAHEATARQEDPQPALAEHAPLGTDSLVICGGQLVLPEDNVIERKVVLLSLIGEGQLS